MFNVSTITDRDTWNNILRTLPYAHVLQTWEWGEFKRVTTGWEPIRLAFDRDGQTVALASIGVRSVGPLKVMYVPKGPAIDYSDTVLVVDVLRHLQRTARHHRAIWLKIDPDAIAATGVPTNALIDSEDTAIDTPNAVGQAFMRTLRDHKWHFSPDQVQFRNTIVINLTKSEDELLAAMSQSTRRKIRIAEREGVTIRPGTVADLPILYDLYRMTGERDDFLTRPPNYYEQAWRAFIDAGLAHPLIAEVDGKPVAHVILFHFAQTSWYFFGASSNDERDKMPNYLLQWHAIQWAKAQGYTRYDLWGAPNVFNESDTMWGVYNFKRGFRGKVTRHVGAWDYVPYPPLYSAYTQIMPRVIARMRNTSNRMRQNTE
jgi:lipid II:glycine glycyltransferase (peptidoglycan interpeptide bridge formation enzyme)